VPKWRDVRDVTRESTGIYQPTLISGGFPCQPFSCAGKQKGKSDDRYLWPEYLRIIRELQPRWIVGENVPGIVKIALDDILDSVEAEGYTAQTYGYPVSLLGAWHKRERLFIVAHSNRSGFKEQRDKITNEQGNCKPEYCGESNVLDSSGIRHGESGIKENERDRSPSPVERGGSYVPHTERFRQSGSWKSINAFDPTQNTEGKTIEPIYGCGSDIWVSEPPVGRVAHGIPSRVDRLRCLGNAVVPQQVYPILKAIADIERGLK